MTDTKTVTIFRRETAITGESEFVMCERVAWARPYWNRAAGRKHRVGGSRARRLWERSVIVASTAGKGEPSIYDPNLLDADIERMEMGCINEERQGTELPQTIPHVRRFYRRMDRVIGGSEGEPTEFILVQWNNEGSVHGYPVTRRYLIERGAAL